ncbi:MAG: ABC transporter substrate-binding protein [Pseudomonadota bacterium]
MAITGLLRLSVAAAIGLSIVMSMSLNHALAGPPDEPRVVDLEGMGRTIGKKGGSLSILMSKPKDIRMMVIYSGARLVSYNDSFELAPDILKSVDVEENRIFTFHIRPGHKWSDGHAFTSEDFRYYWEDVANNSELSQGGLDNKLLVNGKGPKFEVIDELTVRYTWEEPNPLFLTSLAGARPLYVYKPAHFMKQFHPAHQEAEKLAAMVAEANVRNWVSLHTRRGRQYRPENPEMPTLQPWMNTTQPPSERFVFKRNPNFHRVDTNGTQLPYIDEIIMNMSSSSIIPAKTGGGESDLQARYIRFDNYAFLKKSSENHDYKVVLWQNGRGSQMTILPNMNVKDDAWRKVLQDVRVRRALSLGINRAEINEIIYFGLAREAGNSVLPSSPLYKDEHAFAYAEHDPDAANALLDEAGLGERNDDGFRLLPDGRVMEVTVESAGESTEETDVLQLIAEHWAELGIKLFTKPSQRDILRRRISNGETVMSVWFGLNRGLATAVMDPEELAPVSPLQGNWPTWGRYYETKGVAGEKPTLPEVTRLSELYKSWRSAKTEEEQAKIWDEMLTIFTDQVFTIGIVNGTLQPVVINTALQNVPEEGIWAFEPTAYFGHYLPDTFWLDR